MKNAKAKAGSSHVVRSGRIIEIEVGVQGGASLNIESKILAAIDQRFKKGRADVRMVGESVRRGKVFCVRFNTKTELNSEEAEQLRELLKVVVFQAITKMTDGSVKVKTYNI